MSDPVPTFDGWYPDPETGGTKYWEGSRWTGDKRPPRKEFAAAAGYREQGIAAGGFGVFFLVMSLFARQLNDGSVSTVGLFFVFFVLGLAGATGGVYLFRGQGPTTEAIEARLAEERKEAKSKRRAANLAGFAANLGRFGRPQQPAALASNDAALAAQITAVTSPGTARALQNLQNLLYTRAITDDEFKAAKEKLFGVQELDDSFAQIAKLAELHQAGVLGDVEFSAAKARVLRL